MWFGMLLVLAVIGLLWKWILGAAAVVVVWLLVRTAVREHYAVEDIVAEMKADLVARADEQHRWVLAGDPRGIYGRYPPAI